MLDLEAEVVESFLPAGHSLTSQTPRLVHQLTLQGLAAWSLLPKFQHHQIINA